MTVGITIIYIIIYIYNTSADSAKSRCFIAIGIQTNRRGKATLIKPEAK